MGRVDYVTDSLGKVVKAIQTKSSSNDKLYLIYESDREYVN